MIDERSWRESGEKMNDEEVSFRIVRLYFEEIARLGFKRQLDLDQILNAYFYTLSKVKNKDVIMRKAIKEIMDQEKEGKEVKSTTITTTTQEVPIAREVTTTTVTEK